MKKVLLATVFTVSTVLAGCSHPQPYYAPPPPPVLNYQAIEQQGDHDGFEAARHDVATNTPPNYNRHPRFRNPPVPPPGFQAYRRGFAVGYNRFLHPQGPSANY